VRGDFGSRRTCACDSWAQEADPLAIRTPGGGNAFANPSATPITDPRGRPAPLIGLFVPKEGSTPGESGELVYWREL
jgi:hypothetical protein